MYSTYFKMKNST